MRNVTGEQLAQVDNPDPFASPVWRSPVYRTPEGVIYLVQALRGLWRVIWFLIRHPLLDVAAGLLVLLWRSGGWPALAALAGGLAAALAGLRVWRPAWFSRLVTGPVRDRWRWWCYRRRWQPVLGIAGLAPLYQGRRLVPELGKVQAGPCADLITVRLVSGQSPEQFADRAVNLAHGFGVLSCRVRTGRARHDRAGAGPPGRAGRPDPGPAHPGGPGSAGAAGRAPRGRRGAVHPAARDACADRRGDRRREGLVAVGPGPGDAPGDGGRAGPGAGV